MQSHPIWFILILCTMQSGYDAHKALKKDGIQINNVLIVGVKPVDPAERHSLNEKLKNSTNGGFNILRPPQPATGKSSTVRSPFTATPHHRYQQNCNTVSIDSGRQAMGAIALPAKSVVLKVIDLMFGIWPYLFSKSTQTNWRLTNLLHHLYLYRLLYHLCINVWWEFSNLHSRLKVISCTL